MEPDAFLTRSGCFELYNYTSYATGELLAVLDRVEATVPAWSRRGDGRPRLAVRPRRPWSPLERVVLQVRYGDAEHLDNELRPYLRSPDPMWGYVERPCRIRQVTTLIRVARPAQLTTNTMALLFGGIPGDAPLAFVVALVERFKMLYHAWQAHEHLPPARFPRPEVDLAGLRVRVPVRAMSARREVA